MFKKYKIGRPGIPRIRIVRDRVKMISSYDYLRRIFNTQEDAIEYLNGCSDFSDDDKRGFIIVPCRGRITTADILLYNDAKKKSEVS